MRVSFVCPSCQNRVRAEITPQVESLECGNCHWKRLVRPTDLHQGRPLTCLACGCDDLWRQKDFPQTIGLFMVALGALLSTIAWANYQPQLALGILLGFALVDLCLYTFMKDVLVCYRCRARYRNAPFDDDHPRFNLETAERYRQEAARLAKHRPPAPSRS